jgi:glycosyltransferase involved in cell wall biosynthesis
MTDTDPTDGDPTDTDPTDTDPTTRVVIAMVMARAGTTGLQTHVREVSDYLTRARRPVAVVTPMSRAAVFAAPLFGARLAVEKVNAGAGIVWYRVSHQRFLAHALRRELREHDGSVIYAQCPLSARAALDARTSSAQRVVMAVHYDGSQADEWVDKGVIAAGGRVYRWIRSLEQATIPRLDGLVFVSESARRSLVRSVPGAAAVAAAIVPNFTDPDVTDPGGPAVAPIGEPADLVTVGGLEIHKNQTFLLDVLAAANRRGRRFTLDVIGDGPTRARLQQRRAELGLDDQVRLVGRLPSARVALPGHRAYVHAATREAFPYALVEAMAAGLPIVTAATGGIPEMVDDGVEARFWPLDDADAAARVLIALLDDEPARAATAAAALARFARGFDAAVVGPRLERLLVSGLPANEPDVSDEFGATGAA